MIYLGNISDTQSKAFVDNEFKNFQDKYPHVDFFAVDFISIDQIYNRIENNKVVIYYTDIPPYTGLDAFFKLFNNFTNTKFYILTEPDCWQDLTDWPKNVKWIQYCWAPVSNWADDIFGEYRNFECLTDKNFDSKKIGISLNRLPRSHRLISLSYMLGTGLDEHCVITAPLLKWHLAQNDFNLDIMNVVSWDFSSRHENFKTVMLQGWERAKQSDGLFPVTKDAYPPYDKLEPNQLVFDNPANYVNNLMPFYKNSFVEFASFSIYDWPLPSICEKILNCQLGCNFPIFIAGHTTVDWLRRNGFDVFDDIVNHAYDIESDPILRLESAVTINRKLLSNKNYTKTLWEKNSHRFKNNVDWLIKTGTKTLENGRNTLDNFLCNKLDTR